jgi:hypothetical protein
MRIIDTIIHELTALTVLIHSRITVERFTFLSEGLWSQNITHAFVPAPVSSLVRDPFSHVRRAHPRPFQGLHLNERAQATLSHAKNFDTFTPPTWHERVLTLPLDRRSLGSSRHKRGTMRQLSWQSVYRRLEVNCYRNLLESIIFRIVFRSCITGFFFSRPLPFAFLSYEKEQYLIYKDREREHHGFRQ